MNPARVYDNTEISPGVFVLSFARNFSFIPGQVISLAVRPDDTPRLYSIASGKDEPVVRILYQRTSPGSLTWKMSGLVRGDTVFVSDPFGQFTLDDQPALCIAAGTGIAPFLSCFHSGLMNNKVLIHGARYLHSFHFQELLVPAMNQRYVRCCSAEKDPLVFHGRLTDYLREKNNFPADQKCYLCGGTEMVVEARDILISKGVPNKNILSEIYF